LPEREEQDGFDAHELVKGAKRGQSLLCCHVEKH
jgi:hypothetical protein